MARKPEYGRGHENFLAYAKAILEDPAFAGMPDPFGENDEIQWETPSNRKSGRFKDTHQKRLEWWRRKAESLGINWRTEAAWISRVAKIIHPTKMKPCKKCGLEMTIRYAYPSGLLLKRFTKLPYIDESFTLDPNEHIVDLVTRLIKHFGAAAYADLPNLFKTADLAPPVLQPRLDAWIDWLDRVYIPAEPSMLSPGAMSNAPDRFDGFHSFNRCCRSTADPGRFRENLQAYTTDRRVFEYWVDGDWVAADRLMGQVRSDRVLKEEECVYAHPGPCSADHIGPISLGFAHRPEFQFLCKSCNSAKNNRMYLHDVEHLRKTSAAGEEVASWYCKAIWDARKDSVNSNETALRLSKLLRDNRHTVMELLYRLAQAGHYTLLSTLLRLDWADRNPKFENLRAEGHITKFDRIVAGERETKYAPEQKARRLRIAFNALNEYHQKPTRNSYVISTLAIEKKIQEALDVLANSPDHVKKMDKEIHVAVTREIPQEEELRSIVERLPEAVAHGALVFEEAQWKLEEAMNLVAQELSGMWSNDRYVRAQPDEEL